MFSFGIEHDSLFYERSSTTTPPSSSLLLLPLLLVLLLFLTPPRPPRHLFFSWFQCYVNLFLVPLRVRMRVPLVTCSSLALSTNVLPSLE